MNRQEFYSMDEWIEYIHQFMSEVTFLIGDDGVTAVTKKRVPVGTWHKGKGMLIEKRSMKRLVADARKKEKDDG